MNFYAHTQGPDKRKREPLFTPFGEATDEPAEYCSGKDGHACPHCENLAPRHGHLNKVAHLATKFAGEMFPEGPDREAAKQWGYLACLWHDLGKFAPEWQKYLASKSDPHTADTSDKLDHSTAGAQQAIRSHLFGVKLIRLARIPRTRPLPVFSKPLFERFNPRPREEATIRACEILQPL